MKKLATLYDLCDRAILGRELAATKQTQGQTPGQNLRLLYRALAGNPWLKYLLLKHCTHPALPLSQTSPLVSSLRRAMGQAMNAEPGQWRDPAWVRETFAPVAQLMDVSPEQEWKRREDLPPAPVRPSAQDLARVRQAVLGHILRTWDKNPKEPHFPGPPRWSWPGTSR